MKLGDLPGFAALALWLAAAMGCEEKTASPPDAQPTTPAASVTLRVLVVKDAQLADAISRLRGEWAELSGGEMQVLQQSGLETNGDNPPEVDLLVFPSRHLGALCEAGRLRPVRSSTLDSPALDFNDFFPLVFQREVMYGKRVMALPLGCPVPLLAHKQADGPPPATWDDLVTPPAPLTAGLSEEQSLAYGLLARAVCYAHHPARQAVLFDPATMTPRLEEPAFVRAMTDVHRAAQGGQKAATSDWILWPLRPADESSENFSVGLEDDLTVSPLPGAKRIYSPVSKSWEDVSGSPQQVTLLATSGRLVGVTTSSRNATSAFHLAEWLAGKENTRRLSQASPGVANPRMSLALAPDDWTAGRKRNGAGDGRQFAKALSLSLQSRRAVVVPRIPGIDDYLAALGRAVREVQSGAADPAEALAECAQAWEKLTEEQGRDRQRQAYRRSLGLDDYEPPAP